MYKIIERTAGEFIDLETYMSEMIMLDGIEERINEENVRYFEIISKFFILLKGEMFSNEIECAEVIKKYAQEVQLIREDYEFVYNPPAMPSTTEQKEYTIGDDYRKEFAEMYGGYVEMVYLITKGDVLKHPEVMNMKCKDFLFWGNYLLHKKFVENIK